MGFHESGHMFVSAGQDTPGSVWLPPVMCSRPPTVHSCLKAAYLPCLHSLRCTSQPCTWEREEMLKLNIQKTKIMASGPITSWEIDGETGETVSDFIFWAPKSLQMVTAAMKLKDAYSLEGKL